MQRDSTLSEHYICFTGGIHLSLGQQKCAMCYCLKRSQKQCHIFPKGGLFLNSQTSSIILKAICWTQICSNRTISYFEFDIGNSYHVAMFRGQLSPCEVLNMCNMMDICLYLMWEKVKLDIQLIHCIPSSHQIQQFHSARLEIRQQHVQMGIKACNCPICTCQVSICRH